ADTDMNVVCTGDGRFVEVQGTAEAEPFARDELNAFRRSGRGVFERPRQLIGHLSCKTDTRTSFGVYRARFGSFDSAASLNRLFQGVR
ncbi:hypothetical protein ACWHAJ_24620, partial [Prescottella equi]